VVLFSLLVFALFFRLATLMMIHTGVDERDYWFSAKAIAHGLPYPELSHRTTRFSVILPVALAQAVAGSHPDVYYVLPVLNALVQVALAFLIGRRLRGSLAGFLAALALILFPYMIRAASQVRPEIFSVTYILAALYCFIGYFERKEGELVPLLWTAAWMFLAYEAKITNLFFLPGMALAIVLVKRNWAHAFMFAGSILALFLAETGIYALFTEYKMGELSIILKNHFRSDSLTVPHFSSLLGRYSSEHLQAYWQLPFALFGLASVVYLAKRTDARITVLVLASLSFFLGITLEVKSINPITPAESFINRYFSAVLGPLFIVLGYAAQGLAERLWGSLKRRPRRAGAEAAWPYAALLGLGAVLTLGLFSLPRLPSSIRGYANSPLHLSRHPLALNEAYRKEINAAIKTGTPIVAVDGVGGDNAIQTCANYFVDLDNYKNGRPPAILAFSREGLGFYALAVAPGAGAAESCLVAVRTPFRLAPLSSRELGGISDSAFSGGRPPPEKADSESNE
jgi:hypothetical protein